MKATIAFVMMLCLACHTHAAGNASRNVERRGEGSDRDSRSIFLSDIPAYPGNIILARPTDQSVTASVVINRAVSARIVYGADGRDEQRTDVFELKPGEPREVVLDKLPADAACHYRLVAAESGGAIPSVGFQGAFHTGRQPGSSFTFTIQADSHLDGNSMPEVYKATIENALAARPDFHIDLGDTFMTGKIATREDAAKQYLAQRYYLGLIGNSAPLFMVVGNHDGEETAKPDAAGATGLAVWSCSQRKKFFANPIPNAFYTGNEENHQGTGLLQDYYAWTWGDALFVVLDPYWTSKPNRGGTEPWNMTVGKAQYDWLARTLRASKAKQKFVFIHQLVGGLDKGGRGGIEAVPLFEWGGHEKDGKDTFAIHRPGWEQPIHKLLVETGVSAVFHGHDHFFAHQEVDGIVYQLVPQPGHPGEGSIRQAAEYGYVGGKMLAGAGCLKVTVTSTETKVVYMRTGETRPGASDVYSYKITARSH